MNEIKFRAWDENDKSWCSKSDVWINGDGVVNYVDVPLGPEDNIVIEWFIGRHDASGKKVYEGDILHIWCTFHGVDMKAAEVFWNTKRLHWDVKVRNERYKNYLNVLHQSHWQCEVIGDIHQHPELLEAEK